MKKLFLLLTMVFSLSVFAEINPGAKANSFKLKNEFGKEVSLSDFKGKLVVLEWLNHGCPFVRKHYDSKNMQTLQKLYRDKGVVWLSIISSAEGKQGYSTPEKAKEDREKYKSVADHILLDTKGSVGMDYGAKTTPHIYIIDKEGVVRYQGAIDSIASADKDDLKEATNYVSQALDLMLSGKEVKVSKTKAYGCNVKYN